MNKNFQQSSQHFNELRKRFLKHQQKAAQKFILSSHQALKTMTTKAPTSNPVPNKPLSPLPNPPLKVSTIPRILHPTSTPYNKKRNLVFQLNKILSRSTRKLTLEEETALEQLIHRTLGINARVNLNQLRLGTIYGVIHTRMDSTPSLGTWGFIPKELKKYSLAVPIFKSPAWKRNPYLAYHQFRWRKMIVINPQTGDAIIGTVVTAQPATQTIQQFGGSYEVAEALKLNPRTKQGEVLMLFVDDPENKVALGPIQ